MHPLALCAQVIIACSIAFVWIARFPNVVKEFHEYGLPDYIRTLVGAAKITLATLICAAIWYPALAIIPALLMACLMACALAAHWKVHHEWQKYVPATLLLGLSLFVADAYAGFVPL
jgi:DoxX-like family